MVRSEKEVWEVWRRGESVVDYEEVGSRKLGTRALKEASHEVVMSRGKEANASAVNGRAKWRRDVADPFVLIEYSV